MNAILAELTEKEWQTQVKELATLLGFKRAYHTFDSRRSQSGFPDLVLVRDRVVFAELKTEKGKPTDRVVFAELKTEKGKPTDAQKEWLDGLASAGAEVYLWRPSDLDEIASILGRRWEFEKGLGGRGLLRTELWSIAPKSLWIAGRGRQGDAET